MGNRIGVIFHEDWKEFSPFMYSHYGADTIPFRIQQYLKEYKNKHDLNNNDGHLYNPCHMLVGFLQSIDKSDAIRVENLSEKDAERIFNEHEYSNCFEGGCWLVNVSTKHFGEVTGDINYILDNDNIVDDTLEEKI
jgi:hypothetical protein